MLALSQCVIAALVFDMQNGTTEIEELANEVDADDADRGMCIFTQKLANGRQQQAVVKHVPSRL